MLDWERRRRGIIPIVVIYQFPGCFRIIKPGEETISWLSRVRGFRPINYEYSQWRHSHGNAVNCYRIKIASSNLTDWAPFTSYP